MGETIEGGGDAEGGEELEENGGMEEVGERPLMPA